MRMNGICALRSALSLLGCLLFATTVLGASPSGGAVSGSDRPAGAVSAPGRVTTDLLLYELPDGTPAGRHELKASFTVHGKPLVIETLSFETVRKGARIIELLAWHPQQRSRVLSLALDPRSDVQVAISLDAATEVLPVAPLVARTRALQKSGFVPLEARLEKGPAANGRLFLKDDRQDCLDYCTAIRSSCDSDCRDQACPGECEYNYNTCVASCPSECSGPSTYDYTTTVHESFYQVAWSCYDTSFFSPYNPKEFDEFHVTDRTDTHHVTTQCDGSQTNQVISTSHSTYYCWAQQYWSCSPSYGPSWSLYLCN
jgi:hypothetical protein